MKRRIHFLVIAALAAAAPAWAEPQPAPGQMDNFSLSGFCEKGKKNWDVAGTSADIDAKVIKLNDVQSNLYGDNSTTKLTAQKGDFNRDDGKLHLEQDVVVTTSAGARLTTDQLNWDRKAQVVSTPSKVNIEKEDMVITGEGAYGRTDLNKVDLQKDVNVRISGQGQKEQRAPVSIRCDGALQIDYAANTAVFNKNVDVVTADCRIESDTLEVFFSRSSRKSGSPDDFGGSKIDRLVAKGNVKITRNDNISYCEEATYTAVDRKVVLSGSPRLVIYPSEGSDAPAGN